MNEHEPKQINAAFGQYSGGATSVLALIDDIDGESVLLILGETEFDLTRQKDYVLITDIPTSSNRDMLFKPNDFQAALEAYRELKGADAIEFDDDAKRLLIDNKIEVDGIKESGRLNYIIQELGNGHVAVLAICLYFKKQRNIDSTMGMAESFMGFFKTI